MGNNRLLSSEIVSRKDKGDVIPGAPATDGDHRRIGSQGGDKCVSVMELGKMATHMQAILLCRHGQGIASAV
nr:hypothetical protein Puna18p_00123 [Serratia proteamaculans]